MTNSRMMRDMDMLSNDMVRSRGVANIVSCQYTRLSCTSALGRKASRSGNGNGHDRKDA